MTDRRGFTLIELLVVIAVISLLLAIFSPAVQQLMVQGKVEVCKSNIRQLSIAWLNYATDDRMKLVNGSTHGADPWAKYGNENPGNSNRDSLIKTGALYKYCAMDLDIYLCPADPVEHIRSYSIVSLMNAWDWGSLPYVEKYTEIKGPGNQLVFIDENDRRSNSNMGSFAQDPRNRGKNQWVDYVANYHDGGDNVGFADGHSEHWRWEDSRTLEASAKQQFYYPDNGNPDLLRLRKSLFNEMPGAY